MCRNIEENIKRTSICKRVMCVTASMAVLLSLTMCETDFCNENMFVVGTLRSFFKVSKAPIIVVLATTDSNGELANYIDNSNPGFANFSLNPNADTSRFILLSADSLALRKIAIVHSNKNEFVNAECGIRTLSTIDTVLIEDGVDGDSVAIKMKDVDENYDNGNIEIFLAGFE